MSKGEKAFFSVLFAVLGLMLVGSLCGMLIVSLNGFPMGCGGEITWDPSIRSLVLHAGAGLYPLKYGVVAQGPGFHEIYKRDGMLIGKMGAAEYVLDNNFEPIDGKTSVDSYRHGPLVPKSRRSSHGTVDRGMSAQQDFNGGTFQQNDGLEIGKNGALEYVLDQYGEARGVGFHKIHRLTINGKSRIFGTIGALTYILSEDGNPVTKGYHDFFINDNGEIVGILGEEKENVKTGTIGVPYQDIMGP